MQPSHSSATMPRTPWRDAALGALTVALTVAGLFFPLLTFACMLIYAALLQGGRPGYASLLAAVSFTCGVWAGGGFLPATLQLVVIAASIAPLCLFHWRFPDRAHFDGVIAACGGIALGLGVFYGVLYLLLGGDPIAALCTATDQALLADTSPAATQSLSMLWQLKQVFYGEARSAESLANLMQQAAQLSHEQLAAQTQGFLELMVRTALPVASVLLVSLGGLLLYACPTHWLAHPDRGMGLFLGVRTAPGRDLAPFSQWQLPRDIGAGLFIAAIALLFTSFAGLSALDGPMTIVYTLFSAVFYVQGLCSIAYLTSRRGWKRPARVAVLVLCGTIAASIVSMFGTIDYVIRLRSFLDFSQKMKQAAQHIRADVWPDAEKEPQAKKDADAQKPADADTQEPADAQNGPDCEQAPEQAGREPSPQEPIPQDRNDSDNTDASGDCGDTDAPGDCGNTGNSGDTTNE